MALLLAQTPAWVLLVLALALGWALVRLLHG
jgi:hypothetical protein